MLDFSGIDFLRAMGLVFRVKARAQHMLLRFAISLLHGLHEVIDGDARFAFSNTFHDFSYSFE